MEWGTIGSSAHMQEFPETVPATVSALLEKYSVTAPSSLRSGVALALKACCNELEPEHVQRCLEFMLAQGLADADAQIWEQMVSAGTMHPPPPSPLSLTNTCPVVQPAFLAEDALHQLA